MKRYLNRRDAGQLLAREMQHYRGRQDLVVIGLPRAAFLLPPKWPATFKRHWTSSSSAKLGCSRSRKSRWERWRPWPEKSGPFITKTF